MIISEKDRAGIEKFFSLPLRPNKDGHLEIVTNDVRLGFLEASRLEPDKTMVVVQQQHKMPSFIRSAQVVFDPNFENPERITITGEAGMERILYKEEGQIFVK